MNNTDICSDGFPFGKTDDEWSTRETTCDNCGEKFDAEDDAAFFAKASGDNGEFHRYAFCCYACACEFREKHGLVMNRLNESFYDIDFTLDPTVKRPDPVADAVKTIDVDSDATDANDAEEQAEPADEQPALVDNPVHEKKAAECLKELVRRAREITLLDSQIADEKRCLKKLQAERDALVKRQQDFILANADGVQMTFDDCDKSDDKPAEAEAGQPSESADAADELPPEPDDSWRSLPCDTKLPIKLTAKQWESVRSAFPTLGSLQDWLCQDHREKVPGISQAVYDKLVDGLNDYVTVYVAERKKDADEDE